MNKRELKTNDYNSYYQTYIDKVDETELIQGLLINGNKTISFLESISADKYDFAYAKDKWTIKEIVQHIIDTERIFTYRALSFARKEKTSLPGYEHNQYAEASCANNRTKQDLIEEYKALRNGTLALFKSFSEEMLREIGNANNAELSVGAIGFILIGHENHHCDVITERYL